MKRIFFPVVMLMISVLVSCNKKSDTASVASQTTGTFKTYASIDDIFSMLSLQPKVVTLLADSGGSFYGNSGTRYVFQKGCFQDISGTTVTGNVQIEVTEYLKKGDMIFSGMLPISNGQSLLSGGEININVTKNGNELFLRPGMTFQALIPQFGLKNTNMSFFKGLPITGSQDNKVNWVKPTYDTTLGTWTVKQIYDSALRTWNMKDVWVGSGNPQPAVIGYEDSLKIIADTIESLNGDSYLLYPDQYPVFKITVALNAITFSASDPIFTYALYDNQKSLWNCGAFGARTNNIYTEDHVMNQPVHFVSYTLINGHFYGGVLAVTPTAGQNYTVTLTEVDPTAFKGQINAMY